jgi:hypothetical protein
VIDVQLLAQSPRVVLVVFGDRVSLADAAQDRRFGDLVKTFDGAPFRVLCDFRALGSLEDGVADAFLRAQSFSLKQNLERDAFVTADPTIVAEFERIAHDTRRLHWLGPLRFFESFDAARAYVME